jgi:hypothetical protein
VGVLNFSIFPHRARRKTNMKKWNVLKQEGRRKFAQKISSQLNFHKAHDQNFQLEKKIYTLFVLRLGIGKPSLDRVYVTRVRL